MDPDDFLALAAQLNSLGAEAALRTAVSRAYYSAFHSAVALIKEMGVALPVGPESHHKVRYCLMESGEPDGLAAGTSLQTLRKYRNVADYDLAASAEFNATKVRDCIGQARLIIDRLQRCREGGSGMRFRVKLRDYAANVLRLPVTEP